MWSVEMRASSPRKATVLSSGIAASIGATSVATAESPLAFSRSRTVFRYWMVDSFTSGEMPGSPPPDGQAPHGSGGGGRGIVAPARAVPVHVPLPPLAPVPWLLLPPTWPWQATSPKAAANTSSATMRRWRAPCGTGYGQKAPIRGVRPPRPAKRSTISGNRRKPSIEPNFAPLQRLSCLADARSDAAARPVRRRPDAAGGGRRPAELRGRRRSVGAPATRRAGLERRSARGRPVRPPAHAGRPRHRGLLGRRASHVRRAARDAERGSQPRRRGQGDRRHRGA